MQPQLLRNSQARAMFSLGKTTWYDMCSRGLLPQPIRPNGTRSVFWVKAECDAVLAARIAGEDDDAVKALVERLVTARQQAYVAAVGGSMPLSAPVRRQQRRGAATPQPA